MAKVNSDKIKLATDLILEAKKILLIYESFDCPTGGDNYKLFFFEVLKEIKDMDYHKLDGMTEFFLSNEDNILPKSSSGSLHTALQCFDNILCGIEHFCHKKLGIDNEISDDEYSIIHKIYEQVFFLSHDEN